MKHYTRKDEPMEFDAARVTTVAYTFWNDKLYGVTVIFKDKDNYLAMEDILDRTYGFGTKPNRYIDVQYWRGEETFITFFYSRITNVGSLAFISVKVDRKVAVDRAAQNRIVTLD